MGFSFVRFVCLALAAALSLKAATPVEIEKRIDDLLARMTLEEKLGQMSQSTEMGWPISDKIKEQIRAGRWGSFLNAGTAATRAEAQRIALKESRLGIPLLFGRDVIHGYRTVMPIPLAQAASWNPELVRQAARIAAREASGTGIHWTFAPMLDISRDARWGRIAESLGEDPYLSSVLGAAMVKGFQGDSIDAPGSVAACAKHYVGYGAAEAGKDYNTTWIPELLLRDVYLRPFRAVREAGVATFMSAFNAINGVPASGNEFTLKQVLRDEWKFDGFVVSDWNSITEMIPHGYAADAKDAALKGIRAGVDMEMVSTSYFDNGKQLLASRQLTQEMIDDAVRNILRIKFRMGLFDRTVAAADAGAPAQDALNVARTVATAGVVMLKNDGILPVDKNAFKRIAVIGPLADARVDQMGAWVMDARPEEVQTPVVALRAVFGADRVTHVPALKNSRDTSRSGIPEAINAARNADLVLLFLGEEQILSGEAHSRAFLNLPGAQESLVDEVAAAGKPVVTVIMAGRPLTFQGVAAKSRAILYGWHPGTMGGPAIADILTGVASPLGRLPVTFPRTVGQLPMYYNHMNTGRPPSASELGIPTGTPVDPKGYTSKYLDVDFTPEYPFGFGLTYTTFGYANLRVSAPRVPMGGSVTVTAEITNTGQRAGEELVQLYVRDLVGSVVRPVRELKGFERVRLNPGEKRAVTFKLSTSDLAFYNGSGRLVTEPGAFHVWIAPDSSRGVRGEFEVVQ